MPRRTRNSEVDYKYKRVQTKNPSKIGNFHSAFMADEGHKGQHLGFGTWMLLKVKIKTQYTNTKEYNKEGPLNIN